MSVPLDQMSDYARGVVADLGLEAHPEGGWYVRDWQSPQTDEASHRPLSSLIYFLLPEGDMSACIKWTPMKSGYGTVQPRSRCNWEARAIRPPAMAQWNPSYWARESLRTARRESPPAMPWYLQGSGNAPFQERATRLSPVWSVPVLCSTDSRSNNASPSIMRYHIMRYRVRRFRNINSL